MMSVTFKAKTKKSRPSLGPGLKKVSRRAVTKTLTRTQCQVDPDTRKPIRYLSAQWQHNNVRTTFQRPFSDTTVLILSRQMPLLTKHQPEYNGRRNETWDNQSAITHSKIPHQREKNVLKIVFLTLWSWLWAGKLLLGEKQLTVL